MSYSLMINRDHDPTDDERMPVGVVSVEFHAGDDATVLQAVALFLNHITQEERNREARERIFSIDPELERDLNRAQLFQQYGVVRQPDGSDANADVKYVRQLRVNKPGNDADTIERVRPDSAEAKLYQGGD